MTDDQKRKILEEIVELSTPKTRHELPQPNFTVREFADSADIDMTLALKRLQKLRRGGAIDGEKLATGWVWWKVT